jgi:hypothetical protein
MREKLFPARRQALENIPGWTWQKSFDDGWELGLERLKQFVERERHARVPQKYTDENRLPTWWMGKPATPSLSPKQAFKGETGSSGELSDLGLESSYLKSTGTGIEECQLPILNFSRIDTERMLPRISMTRLKTLWSWAREACFSRPS